jgi:hypothetical protein
MLCELHVLIAPPVAQAQSSLLALLLRSLSHNARTLVLLSNLGMSHSHQTPQPAWQWGTFSIATPASTAQRVSSHMQPLHACACVRRCSPSEYRHAAQFSQIDLTL